MPVPKQQYFAFAGIPLVGGKVYTYAAGSVTPKATYTDSAGTVAQANPIILNARGEPANAIFWAGAYKVEVRDALDNVIYTVDNYNTDPAGLWGLVATFLTSDGATMVGNLRQSVGTFLTTLDEVLGRNVNVWDFMSPAQRTDALSGAPVLDHASAWNAAIVALGGAGRVFVPRKGVAVYLLKSTVSLGTSNSIDSNVVIDIEPGTLIKATLPNIGDVLFDVKNFPGHFNNQGIRNLKLQSTNGNGAAIKFSGQCFGSFENLYIEGFNCGIFVSNAGTAIYNEFIRFNNVELHLNTTAILLHLDGGTDTSMHGLAFQNTTINVGVGQVGLQHIDICWYNGDADLKFFSQAGSTAIIKMSTSGTTFFKGVFISGSITCEGAANMIGTGRFYLAGNTAFLSGVTDTLVSPDAWEQGFMAYNYIKQTAYGASGLTVSEVPPKSGSQGTTGPVASFAQLTKANVQSLIANCYGAHAGAPGNGFYTGYTGSHTNYGSGVLGCFLASDGTEFGTSVPTATACAIKHNAQFIIRYDGVARTNSTEGFLMGSGGAGVYSGTASPEGVLTASVGSTFARRDGGALTSSYVKESGVGNVGWVAK